MIYKTIIQPRKQKPSVCMKKQKSPYNLFFIISNDYLNVNCNFNKKTLHFMTFFKIQKKNVIKPYKKAIKSKALNRAFKLEVPDTVYENLLKELESYED